MRAWPFAAAALLASGSVAQACQCEDPAAMSEADKEAGARWIAKQHMIVAEVERLERTGAAGPDVYKVIRPLVGTVGKEIRVSWRMVRLPDGSVIQGPITSCDYTPPFGVRRVMAFAANPPHAPGTVLPCSVLGQIGAQEQLTPASMCTQYALEAPGMVERVRAILAEQE